MFLYFYQCMSELARVRVYLYFYQCMPTHFQSVWGVYFTSAFQSVNLIFTSVCPPSECEGSVYLYFYQCISQCEPFLTSTCLPSECAGSVYLYFSQCVKSVSLIFTSACPPSVSLLLLCSGELTELCGHCTSTAISLETQGVASTR